MVQTEGSGDRNLGMLDELVALQHLFEFLTRDEVVIAAGGFARTRRPRGPGDGKLDATVVLEHGIDQAGLAGAGRGHHDEEIAVHVRTGPMFAT